MLKNNNVVLTREQLAEAKQLHSDSYNEYLERKRKLYTTQETSFIGTVIFLNKVKMLTKAKTMKQCVREVISKDRDITTNQVTDNQHVSLGDFNGI